MFTVKHLAIIGSRAFDDYALMKATVLEKFDLSALQTIISGAQQVQTPSPNASLQSSTFPHAFSLPIGNVTAEVLGHGGIVKSLKRQTLSWPFRRVLHLAQRIPSPIVKNWASPISSLNHSHGIWEGA